MAATMSGRLFLISKSVPQNLLGAGMAFAEVVVGIFIFPLCLEEMRTEVIAGLGLA